MDSKAMKRDFIRFMRSKRGGAPAMVPKSISLNAAGKAPAALRPPKEQRGQSQGMLNQAMPLPQPQMPPVGPLGMGGASTPVPRPLGAPVASQGLGSQGLGAQGVPSQGLVSGLQRLAQLRGASSLYPPLGDSERH